MCEGVAQYFKDNEYEIKHTKEKEERKRLRFEEYLTKLKKRKQASANKNLSAKRRFTMVARLSGRLIGLTSHKRKGTACGTGSCDKLKEDDEDGETTVQPSKDATREPTANTKKV